MTLYCKNAVKLICLITTFLNSSLVAAQEVVIHKRIQEIAPYWTQQGYKKVRYEGYSLWVEAYDGAVRQANVSLCGNGTAAQASLARIPGINGAVIAWRTGSEARYHWLIMANYYAGDVVWVDTAQNAALKVGDVVIFFRGLVPPPKYKIKIAPNLLLPKAQSGDADFDKLAARRDPVEGGYFRYRTGVFTQINTSSSPVKAPLTCGGKGSVSFGGLGISLSSMVKGATGIGKALIDDDPNRYYRGSGIPVYRRFTSDVFTEAQLRWMIVDQFATDLSEGLLDKLDREGFDSALRQLESATALRLGHPASTEAFGQNWRARAAFVAVYAGGKLDLGEKDYVSFLDERDKVTGGGLNASRAAVRADILRAWFSAAARNPNKNQMTAANIRESMKSMTQ